MLQLRSTTALFPTGSACGGNPPKTTHLHRPRIPIVMNDAPRQDSSTLRWLVDSGSFARITNFSGRASWSLCASDQ
eukprot:3158485-Pyramimonas_sp.AAC.1